LGIKNFLNDIHQNALFEGKTEKKVLELKGMIQAFFRTVPTILKHSKFSECTENQERATAHLMVLYGFIGLFIVTNIFFVVMYGFGIHGPYSQLNPVKWLANISGLALIIGGGLLIKNRIAKKDQVSTYKDWYLLGVALALGITGMLTQMTRLGGLAGVSYFIYFIHLVGIWMLFAYTPYSKLAHLAYRTVAMTYNEYSGRK
jgi:quinone-modifying oxidoreductase subunit QmoC